MGKFTFDPMRVLPDAVSLIDDELVHQLITDAGNEEYEAYRDSSLFGQGVVECEKKPRDSGIYGIKWYEVKEGA